MAVLHHLRTDRMASLGARTTIGRSRACTLRIDAPRASGEHAAMVWTADGWRLRDLGSSNGTWIGDTRLIAGAETPVAEGAALAFGDTDDRWVLVDARPPTPFARTADGAETVDAEGGVLGLPSGDDPRVMVFQSGGRWVAEDDRGPRPVSDQDPVVVDGVAWRLFLPVVIDTTVMDEGPRAIGGLRLGLRVSRDHEFVAVTLAEGERVVDVPPRTMHYMLVVLAQAKREATGPAGERGWVDREAIAQALAVDPRTVDVYVLRLRQQLGRLGVPGAADILERGPGGQFRLGAVMVELTGA